MTRTIAITIVLALTANAWADAYPGGITYQGSGIDKAKPVRGKKGKKRKAPGPMKIRIGDPSPYAAPDSEFTFDVEPTWDVTATPSFGAQDTQFIASINYEGRLDLGQHVYTDVRLNVSYVSTQDLNPAPGKNQYAIEPFRITSGRIEGDYYNRGFTNSWSADLREGGSADPASDLFYSPALDFGPVDEGLLGFSLIDEINRGFGVRSDGYLEPGLKVLGIDYQSNGPQMLLESTAVAIPEPSAAILALLGLVGLMIRR